MAHTTSPTVEGYTELGVFFSGEGGTCAKSIVLIKTGCTGNAAQTYAGITKATESGLSIANATMTAETTTVTDDTCQATHQFTAGATLAVLGAAMCNDDDDVIFMIVCWEATINVESGDTITPTLGLQFKTD